MGLAKKVWSRKPDRLSAPPSSAAIRMRGRRIFQMMLTWVGSPLRRNRMRAISPMGIGTLPTLMLSTMIAQKATASTRNTMP